MSRGSFIITTCMTLVLAGCGRAREHSAEPNKGPMPTSRQGSPERIYGREDAGAGAVPLAPGDGGDTAADRATAQRIRGAIMLDEELAPAGSNITVTVRNGQVRVQGRVGSKQEQRAISAMVEKKTGALPAVNELQVKNTPR